MKAPTLDPRMEDRLQDAERRLAELDSQLSSPEVLSSPDALRELGQERAHLDELTRAGQSLHAALEELEGAIELGAEAEDPEMREMAAAEVAELEPRVDELKARVRELLIPPDPLADRAAGQRLRVSPPAPGR